MRHIGLIAAELRRKHQGTLTKKAVVSELRAVDGMRSKDAEAMFDKVSHEAYKQKCRIQIKENRKPTPSYRHLLPSGLPEDRLKNKIISWCAAPSYMNKSSEYTKDISLTSDPSKVGYIVTTGQGWRKYGRKGWMRSTVDHHLITLPRWFMSRVVKNGIRCPDGIPTLDAKKLDSPHGCELYAARWVTQGRGYAVNVEDGYIAKSGIFTFHGKTAKSALRGLERKVQGAKFSGCTMDQLASVYPDQWVSLSDLKAIGACEPGIKMWVERTGMQKQLQAGGATIKEIASGYAICPAPEARAAALRALRKTKTASV